MKRDKDTICALATAHGIGAISVVRISGTEAAEIIRKLAAFLPENLESHKIYYGLLKSVDRTRSLDEVLVSYFREGRSFTGEHTFEISCHGSESVVNDVINQLIEAGARHAERGEFTYRAFMNGRIDLVQAESVLALIESRSSRATNLALRQLQGDFSKRINAMLLDLTWILAHTEANIDFASEDIQVAGSLELSRRLEKLIKETDELLGSYKQGRIVRNGFHIALVGRPNAGKSSLLNAFAGEERAIVTPTPGTTRDFVEALLALEGFRVTLIDTAGLRLTDDSVEKIGVERTLAKLAEIEMVWYVADASTGISTEDLSFLRLIPKERTIILWNKVDLTSFAKGPLPFDPLHEFSVSARSGVGLNDVKDWLSRRLRAEVSEDSTMVSNARHFQGLQVLRKCLESSLPLVVNEESPDLIALELQTGLRALYEILGQTFDDQVMDRVFKEFCLGK